MTRLLLVEGTPEARRREAAARGMRSHGAVYAEALLAHFPDVQITVLNAADPGASLPPGMTLDDFAGLVIGGSNLHVYNPSPAVTAQLELLRAFGETGRPMIASCWGLQVAVVAAGGSVVKSPNGREVAIARQLSLTDAGRAHPLYAGKPSVFDAPCMHYDEVATLPPGATLLCRNAHSPVQAAVIPLGRSEVWAMQYHPEFDLRHIGEQVAMESAAMVAQGFFAGQASVARFADALVALDANPAARSLAEPLGIGDDLLDPARRRIEIVNWMEACVLRPK